VAAGQFCEGFEMTERPPNRAIDCLINVHFGETEQQPTWMLKVRDDYFRALSPMFAPVDLSALLDEMDAHGVQRAVLMDNLAKPSVTARKFVQEKPDRFALAIGGFNLLRPMPGLRELGALVNDLRSRMPLSGRASGAMDSTRPAMRSITRFTPNARSSSCHCA